MQPSTTDGTVSVRGITRSSRTLVSDVVTSLEDIVARQREVRLSELRAAADDKSSGEWIELLETDNKEQAKKIAALRQENTQFKNDLESTEAARDEFVDKLATTRFGHGQERERAIEAESRVRILERQIESVNSLASLPENLPAIIDLIERLHPSRIVFLDKAKQSAQDASINNQKGEMNKAWKCLWAMATVLHELIFDEDGDVGSLTDNFHAQTGFDITLTETTHTKKDKRLKRLRTASYKGEKIDITPHVKYGNKAPKCLRVYYHAHHGDQLIVVGHCGDHLETDGTRRRK